MSETKRWLADEANYSSETRRGLANPEIASIIRGVILRKRMLCADGFIMSVQYSTGHYCNGRERFMGGEMESGNDPYPEPKTVEIGFPSKAERLLKPYAEEPSVPMGVKQRYLVGNEGTFLERLYEALRWGDRWERWIAENLWPQRSNLTNTVYGWVPVEVVDQIIAKHGGLVAYDGEYPERGD